MDNEKLNKFKEHQKATALCPYCNTLMTYSIDKQSWFEKIFRFPISDSYICEKCGAGPF